MDKFLCILLTSPAIAFGAYMAYGLLSGLISFLF